MTTTFGLFNTSVMGMAAQSNALGSISENIANSSTIGYKDSKTSFETVLNGVQAMQDLGGGVDTTNRISVGAQGALLATSSSTDLAVKGSGFFIVSNAAGDVFLTRAGSFVPDAQGRLVNSAGFFLMGFPANGSATPTTNDVTALKTINVQPSTLVANPSTTGVFSANLPSQAAIVAAGNLPSVNAATSTFTSKGSLTAYDNLGAPVTMDVYFSKTAANTWEMAIYNHADATNGGFPYANPALATSALTFNATTGALTGGSPTSIALPAGATVSLDLSNTTQLGAAFSVNNATVDGNAAAPVSQITISKNGVLNYQLGNGQSVPAYDIPLGEVASPTNMQAQTGNVFIPTPDSGQLFIGVPGSGQFGNVAASTLEQSTVDLASQLSAMIIAQRSFTANSQTFQVASDILQVLNNLK